VHYVDETELLYAVGSEEIVTYDLSGRMAGEASTVRRGEGVQANGMSVTGSVGSVLVAEEGTFEWQIVPFDADTGELLNTSTDVQLGRRAAVLPDGRIVVFRREGVGRERVLGPVAVWDPVADTYEDLFGCRLPEADLVATEEGDVGECPEPGHEWFEVSDIHVHEPSNVLLVSDLYGRVLLFDASSLELLEDLRIPMEERGGIEEFGGDWVAVSSGGLALASNQLRIVSMAGQETIATIPGGVTALSPDETRLAVGDGRGGYTLFDTDTWEPVAEGRAGDARIRGIAFSPSGDQLMTSGTDGIVRIWDVEAGLEVQRVPLTFPNDGHWIDEERLLISFEDKFTVVSLDLAEVTDLAFDRLTRGFTADECAAYRIDPCPTLEELQDG
jgi:WD40 repeat protein